MDGDSLFGGHSTEEVPCEGLPPSSELEHVARSVRPPKPHELQLGAWWIASSSVPVPLDGRYYFVSGLCLCPLRFNLGILPFVFITPEPLVGTSKLSNEWMSDEKIEQMSAWLSHQTCEVCVLVEGDVSLRVRVRSALTDCVPIFLNYLCQALSQARFGDIFHFLFNFSLPLNHDEGIKWPN